MLNVIKNKPKEVDYIFYDFLPSDIPQQVNEPRYAADIFRFKLLSEHDDYLWMDCDVEIKKWFDFPEKGKPYFSDISLCPDVGIMYCNGCTDFFKMLLNSYTKDAPLFWYEPLLCNNKDNVYLIPRGYFHHYFYGPKVG
jgi:hypothetical protein